MPSAVTVLISEMILILRTYAVYDCSKSVLGAVSLVWILHLVSISCVMGGAGNFHKPALSLITLPESSFIRKLASLNLSKTTGLFYIAPAIVFDTTVGGLLTLGLYRKSRPFGNMMPLVRLIIKDGLLYFTVVFLTNISWMLLLIFEGGGANNDIIRFLPLEMWSSCITATMIGRLTLNLRMYNQADNELTFQSMTVRFGLSHQGSLTLTPDNDLHEGST
ncbi:hypothetical protein BDZ94DRAFT_1249772 [Collybia nuda]|uniref:Uncharacterized protein n=1 Tax=Collybia nuda TaxID=64659 RepID=A0A9P5YGE3_9AGAR|nr:hypothetical protein BDZ94DRAFT_1249772 [Collybia nuda]